MSERSYVILGILAFIIGILTLAYTTVAGILSTEGGQLSQIEAQIHALHNENLELEDQYLHERAYTTIYQEATREGFVPANQVILR